MATLLDRPGAEDKKWQAYILEIQNHEAEGHLQVAQDKKSPHLIWCLVNFGLFKCTKLANAVDDMIHDLYLQT